MYIIYDIEYLMYKYNSQICDGVSYMRCNKCSIDHMPHVTNIVYMYIAYYLYYISFIVYYFLHSDYILYIFIDYIVFLYIHIYICSPPPQDLCFDIAVREIIQTQQKHVRAILNVENNAVMVRHRQVLYLSRDG